MPTDEELVELARTTPAFRHHLRDPNAPFTTPPRDLVVEPPDTPVDDHASTPEELREMFPAMKAHRPGWPYADAEETTAEEE